MHRSAPVFPLHARVCSSRRPHSRYRPQRLLYDCPQVSSGKQLTHVLQQTRIETGIDYRFLTFSNIVTSGVTTATVTVVPPTTPIPIPLPSSGRLLSSTVPLPPTNSTVASSSGGLPGLSLTGLPLAPSFPPVGPASVVPIPQPSSVLLPPSVNTTLPSGPIIPIPQPSSVFPPLSVNMTLPSGPTAPPLIPASGLPAIPRNGSSPTTGGSMPTGDLVPNNCPANNGSIYTTLGQTFQILCLTNFIGPSDQGLYVTTFYACVHDCAIANVGFSQSRCYAASYIPNNGVGSDCFFRTLNSSQHPIFDPKATSAILVNNTVNPNITYNATVSASAPWIVPTGLPTANTSLPINSALVAL